MTYKASLNKRALQKLVKIPSNEKGCKLWQGKRNAQGYGKIWNKEEPGKESLAHRVIYEAFFGPITKDLCVLHKCDTPSCCNPDHLFLGTRIDNALDRNNKKRTQAGERHYASVLRDAEVMRIRHLYSSGKPLNMIAAEYRISYKHAWKIVKNLIRKP